MGMITICYSLSVNWSLAICYLLSVTCYMFLAFWCYLHETSYYLQKLVPFARCCTSRNFLFSYLPNIPYFHVLLFSFYSPFPIFPIFPPQEAHIYDYDHKRPFRVMQSFTTLKSFKYLSVIL